jgi:hypothetical protein
VGNSLSAGERSLSAGRNFMSIYRYSIDL